MPTKGEITLVNSGLDGLNIERGDKNISNEPLLMSLGTKELAK